MNQRAKTIVVEARTHHGEANVYVFSSRMRIESHADTPDKLFLIL